MNNSSLRTSLLIAASALMFFGAAGNAFAVVTVIGFPLRQRHESPAMI